ncbi:RNA recognition motif domain [Trinorchestia longiramus]|nr:RNA recognition motif domain [Trinorchestia longiramus]
MVLCVLSLRIRVGLCCPEGRPNNASSEVESVSLALQILDGSCVSASSTQRIRVERARFQMRGEYDASLKPKKKKKKLIEKLQKKQEKLFAWTPEPLRGQRSKNESVVVIRNAVTPEEFMDHAERILTHTESLRAQCASFGAVKKLELYDRHPEGAVKVMFTEVEAADLCIASMNNRLYNGRKLSVAVWDGLENFRVEETEEEKAERLKKWDEFLMKSDDNKQKTSDISGKEENSSGKVKEIVHDSAEEKKHHSTQIKNESTGQEMKAESPEETSS